MHRPLLVSDDPALLDQVIDLAARHALEIDVAPSPDAARPRYPSAPLVLIGDEAAPACAQAGLPGRPGVVLVSRGHGMARLTLLAEEVGAERVVRFPDGVGYLAEELRRLAAGIAVAAAEPARVLAVVGGRGGAGATVLAAGLTVTAGLLGLRSLLVDADPLGGGADLVLGWENIAGLRWRALSATSGAIDPPALVGALPSRGDVAVLSCGRGPSVAGEAAGLPAEAMASALDAGRRGCDLVVADLPRRLDEAAVLALRAADRVLLVVPAELRACVAAGRVAETLAPHTDALHVVVRGPAPGSLRAKHVARSLRLPVAGTLQAEPALPRDLELGRAPAATGSGPLAGLCRRILADAGLDRSRLAAGAAA
ncbi:septum site-determining protein Ssd [Dactylosporangium sp. CA-233914]|uniref:septum site-determining protein Ssd n=1 Tax=Dactylosporangium sp. CA-233914 TaxID=3239934 RepID=UPI003D8E216A